MDLSVNKRLNDFLSSKDFEQKDLAEALGVKKQQVSNWLNLNEQIPVKHYPGIIKYFTDLPARWFITGESEMLNKEVFPVQNESNDPGTPYNKVTSYSCPDCISKEKEINALKIALEAKEELLEHYRGKKESPAATGT